jgi:hypothetical protein
VQPVLLPVPWAREPSISFLSPPSEVRETILRSGFRELAWRDVSASAHEWWRTRRAATAQDAPSPLGLHLFLGADTGQMFQTMMRNLDEERITVVQALFARP